MLPRPETLLHSFDSDRIAGLLDPALGLTGLQAEERRRQYGGNDIVGEARKGWAAILLETAADPMVWFLVATALIFAWLGDYAEATVLALALLPIAGMDAYLHRRTQATTEGLAGRLATTARVLRDGRLGKVNSVELVPGDLVSLREGDPFPADGIILSGTDMQADESALTGESMPVRKHPFRGELGSRDAMVEDDQWGAAGTRLLTGEARLRVVFTGGETLYGEIVRSAREGPHELTPLQSAIGRLVAWLVSLAVLVCIALAVTRYLQGFGLLDAFLSGVTLAVAALPEEFPVAFTFFLGVGVYRLAQRQALVRRAVVVENIGRVTAICSDKTGTITEGKVGLAHVIPAAGVSEAELRESAALASRSGSGDPIDAALLSGRTTRGAALHTYPFTEGRRRETNITRDGDALLASSKGAPETIFAICELSQEERSAWHAEIEALGAGGHKVLACAQTSFADLPAEEPDRGFRFLGLLAFEDPVREGVREAVARAQAAGIRVIMVTGDHATTALAVARSIGLGQDEPRLIEGPELEQHPGRADFDVVARAMPAQKLDLVRGLRAAGEIVAVTGDGVNDVPALQGADVGIAMGQRGTRSAREVASIVLLDDNFRTIVRAIAEGRQLFANLKLSFAYLLLMHIPLVATAALIPFAGFPLLYLPMHVVWLELVIHPTALLVFQELPPSDALDPVTRHSKLRVFTARQWGIILVIGAMLTALILVGYTRSLGPGSDVEHARSMALVALLVASATMTAGLSRLRSHSAVIAVLATLASAAVLVQIPALARLLHLSPLHADDWGLAGFGGLVIGALAALLSTRPAPDSAKPSGVAGRAGRPAA